MTASTPPAAERNPKLLMICYYYPPFGMGGVQRPLKFAKYLPEFGWDVTVIAPESTWYHHTDSSLLDELPSSVMLERVSAFTPARLLGALRRGGATSRARLTGQNSRLTAIWRQWSRFPDDKIGFARSALKRARQIARNDPFDVVWTTSPPPSSHRVGEQLCADVGWIADFRDPWSSQSGDWGPSELHARFNRRRRRRIVQRADRVVAVNDVIAADLNRDNPRRPTEVIHNGFDEADFQSLDVLRADDAPYTILCPGTFGGDSDPSPIFQVLKIWIASCGRGEIRVVHVGASQGIDSVEEAKRAHLQEVYEDHGYIPHAACIEALVSADLIVIAIRDSPGCGAIVPGRLFEALRTLRPILLLVPKHGATARLVEKIPGCWVAAPGDIHAGLAALNEIHQLERGRAVRALSDIAHFERREQTRRLATLCDEIRCSRDQEYRLQ